jgi:hypothetical protein
MFGSSALQAGLTEAQQTEMASDINSVTSQTLATNASAISDSTPIATASGMTADAGTAQVAGGLANADTTAAGAATTPGAVATANVPATGNASGNVIGAQGGQAAAANTQNDINAVGNASGHEPLGMSGETGSVNSGSPPSGPAATNAAVAPKEPITGPSPGGVTQSDLTGVTPPGADAYKTVPAGSPAPRTGLLGKAADFLTSDSRVGSAAVTGVGNLLGGVGQGIGEKQAMAEQAAAQEYIPRLWQNSQLTAPLRQPAAPIPVAQGYLARAQAVRNMLSPPLTTITPPVQPPAPNAALPQPSLNTPIGGMI